MEDEKKAEEVEEVKGGELLFCGTTAWDLMGRRKSSPEENLISPTRLRPLMGVDIRFVAAGCASCHCVALDVEGRCYTWGRNEKGQLGHGDKVQRDRPTIVSELSQHKIVRAGAGRSHSVVVTEDAVSFAFGWNKHGQLGSGSAKNEIESFPVRCNVSEVKTAVCGGDFTVWLTSVEGSSIMTAGLPQYGQLGHGSDNEYNTKDSSVKLAYEAQPRPRAIASLSGETIVKVACGTNHSVAVDKKGHVYTWGYGGYGRLGHREQKDEWVPRLVDVFTRHNVLPPNAVVSAGSANSSCTASMECGGFFVIQFAMNVTCGGPQQYYGGGQLYMWGKIKSSGDDWMYPKPLMDLRSSATPKKVDILEGMHVISVACGSAHSLVVVDRSKNADQLEELDVHDGKDAVAVIEDGPAIAEKTQKKSPAKKSQNSNKRKKGESTSEDDGNSEYDSDDSDEILNGEEEEAEQGRPSGRGRGKNTGKSATVKKSSGRGRGRPPSGTKSTQSAGGKGTGRRGRPKKS
ncbi:hypothetical protein OROHE_022580 [Orobanche hederae]